MSAKAIGSESELVSTLAAAAGKLVVVDFWAKWCGPCMSFAPTFEAMAAEYASRDEPVVFLKVEDTTDAAQARGIKKLPTFKLYLKSAEVAMVRGGSRARRRGDSLTRRAPPRPAPPRPAPCPAARGRVRAQAARRD